MNKTVGIVIALAMLGVAAFIFLKPAKKEEKADPVSNMLATAPGFIDAGGNIASSTLGAGQKVLKGGIDLALTGPRAVISTLKSLNPF